MAILLSFLLTACGNKNESGRVIKFGQAVLAGGGIVQSYVRVQLDDGSEVLAWLPIDDALWVEMREAARSGKTLVEIKPQGDAWEFVQVLPGAWEPTPIAATGEILLVTPKSRPLTDGNSMGDPNAPLKIVEYSDFQCSHCKVFADTIEQALIDNYIATGKVYFVYRSMGNFTSQAIGEGTESRDAAEAAYCASDQGKFWEYKDILFANTLGEEKGYFARPRLEKMAQAIGLDLDEFKTCLDSQKHRPTVEQDFQDGTSAGLPGVPAFLINGKVLLGAQPYETFKQEIDAALQDVN
jgi:protein-disulfide isomerase